MKTLLYYLRALSFLYQHMHWRVSGEQYYGDHLLYERLYNGVNGEIDVVAEKAIGVADDSDAIKPNEDAEIAKNILSKLLSDDDSSDDFPKKAINAEHGMMKVVKDLMEQGQSDGVEDMLQGIASKHEEHLYLLQQRNRTANLSPAAKLFKLAYHADLQGLHSEADAIAEVMKTLSERVGISEDDMVSLADYFDSQGDTTTADYFDNMLKKK